MAIDNCSHGFETLAHEVLPGRMVELRESMSHPINMADLAAPGTGPKGLAKRYGFASDFSGCYVLLEKGTPVYVGISRHVLERLQQHVRKGDHLTATLAYRMAVREAPHGTYAVTAMQDPAFRAAFERRQEYLRGLSVAVVRIDNPVELYLFEVYAAMELDTLEWNTFATH